MTNSIDRSVKARLRGAALAQRDALDPAVREAFALAIAKRPHLIAVPRNTVVSGYMPIRGEMDPRPLMQALAARGAHLAMPTVAADGQALIFRTWREGDAMRRGAFGIQEPLADAAAVVPDLVLVPLAAFDRRGHRIGYGAGYYDRALATLRLQKSVTAIGLAFAIQEVDRVPNEAHDVPLDLVLTETESITLRSF